VSFSTVEGGDEKGEEHELFHGDLKEMISLVFGQSAFVLMGKLF